MGLMDKAIDKAMAQAETKLGAYFAELIDQIKKLQAQQEDQNALLRSIDTKIGSPP